MKDIVAAIGMTEAELFAGAPTPSGKPEVVTTYDYTDLDGNLLYQVVRRSDKSFLKRRPDGRGSWGWNIKGTSGSSTSWEMHLVNTIATGRWWCLIALYEPGGNFLLDTGDEDIICCDFDTGHLKGQFAVPGINGGFGVDCTGCTATVTLGG